MVSPPLLLHFIFALSHFLPGCSPVTSRWSWCDAEVVETNPCCLGEEGSSTSVMVEPQCVPWMVNQNRDDCEESG